MSIKKEVKPHVEAICASRLCIDWRNVGVHVGSRAICDASSISPEFRRRTRTTLHRSRFGALLLYLSAIWLSTNVVQWIKWSEERLVKIPAADILFGALGLIFGLIVAFLIEPPLSKLPIPGISSILPFLVSGLLGYLGFRVGYKKRDELLSIFTMGRQGKDQKKKNRGILNIKSWIPV